LFLDLIGYSEEQHGYNLCAEKMPNLGYLEIDMDSENPVVKITDKSLDESKVKRLPDELRGSLRYIISLLATD
jgi:hypothetical protein